MTSKLSVQAQLLHDPTRDLARLRELNPTWVKYFQPDPNRTRELLDMGFKVCLRVHDISERQGELARTPAVLGQQHGEFWGIKLRHEWGLSDGQLARIAVEGINEPSVANETEAARVNTYGMAFAESAAQHGLRVATPNLSTGWPYNNGPGTPPDYDPFRGLVGTLRRTNSYWASHEYCDRRGPDSDDWTWNMGRILQRPGWFRGVKILITECAYDQAVNAPRGTPHHGWNGHMSAVHYAANVLGVYDQRMQADPDVESLMVFLLDTDNPAAWWTFNVDACWNGLVAHARWMESQPPPGPQPPTPPVEPPTEPPITPPVEPPPPVTTRQIIDPLVAQAILEIESGAPFGGDGRLIIRFEAHVFRRQLQDDAQWHNHFRTNPTRQWEDQQWRQGPGGSPGHEWQPIHTGSQANEWAVFELASRLNRNAALNSISMGRAQIMGFNHAMIGYPSADAMFRAFSDTQTGEAAQILGFINFLLASGLLPAMQRKDWREIARVYNGPGNVDVYAPRLQAAYERLVRAGG